MTRIVRRIALLSVGVGLLAAAAAGCSNQGAAETKEVGRPAVAVTVTPVVSADLQESVDVVGSLTPKFSVEIKSEISGIVTAVYVNEWVPVRRGSRLALLDSRETEAGIEALKAVEAQAKVGESRARREFDRAQQLKQFGLITPQAFDEAQSAVEAAEAAVSAARAQVKAVEARLAKAVINSPMDGVVALRTVNVGDRVENMGGNTPMFRIVDNRLLELTFAVPSSRIAAVRVGQAVEFSTDALPGRSFTGKVAFINPAIDEATRSAKVIAEVRNADGQLKGGAFAKGRIILASRPGVLQVPREALLNWDVEKQTADVFVIKGDQAERKPVKTGHTSDGTVEIASGLSAGESIVVRGGFALRPGDRVTATAGQGV